MSSFLEKSTSSVKNGSCAMRIPKFRRILRTGNGEVGVILRRISPVVSTAQRAAMQPFFAAGWIMRGVRG